MQTLSLIDYQKSLLNQGVPRDHYAFKCPMCGTIQSANDFISAGAGANFDQVEPYLAFSCIGRFTGAGAPRKTPDGLPCNWTLGGLFSMHKVEVLGPDGRKHPVFEVATPAEALSKWELAEQKNA